MMKTIEEKYPELNKKTQFLLLKYPIQSWDENVQKDPYISTQHYEIPDIKNKQYVWEVSREKI